MMITGHAALHAEEDGWLALLSATTSASATFCDSTMVITGPMAAGAAEDEVEEVGGTEVAVSEVAVTEVR